MRLALVGVKGVAGDGHAAGAQRGASAGGAAAGALRVHAVKHHRRQLFGHVLGHADLQAVQARADVAAGGALGRGVRLTHRGGGDARPQQGCVGTGGAHGRRRGGLHVGGRRRCGWGRLPIAV